jgi:hypothetical protein
MSETSAARGPNWLGFAGAALILLLVCFAALAGDMLSGGGSMGSIAAIALGYAAVAGVVEWKRRNFGIMMLIASPLAFIAFGMAVQMLRGA